MTPDHDATRRAPATSLPPAIAELALALSTTPGVLAVVLGGSRALGTHDAQSDWDLGLYYRGTPDLSGLAARGTVHPPGSWGRLMNGGAWLQCGTERVDVLLRAVDVVEHWTARATAGDFEVDALLGYSAGAPTYLLSAELAHARVLHGTLPAVTYPDALATAGPPRWRFCRSFSLAYARAHAARGDQAAAIGQVAKAVMEEAHAIACERRCWVCNEKRLITDMGLAEVQSLFAQLPSDPAALGGWIDRVAVMLGAPPDERAPWQPAAPPTLAGA